MLPENPLALRTHPSLYNRFHPSLPSNHPYLSLPSIPRPLPALPQTLSSATTTSFSLPRFIMKPSLLLLHLLLSTLALAHIRTRTLIANDIPTSSLPTLSRARVGPCGDGCEFSLCNSNGIQEFFVDQSAFTILNAPKVAATPYICREDEEVGLVLRSGQVKVVQGDKLVPISKWQPRGLKKKFKRNFIKTFKIPNLPRAGFGRLSSTTNQWSVLHDRCMVMPISRYQRIDKRTGTPLKIINSSGKNSCVSFRTTAPAIQVMLTWDTADDFDLEITEPDGDILTFRNKQSESGKLNGDNNVGKCKTTLFGGRENVIYFPGAPIENGKYLVRVIHFRTCDERPTNYLLRIVINGVLKTQKEGFSNKVEMQQVGTASFNWP